MITLTLCCLILAGAWVADYLLRRPKRQHLSERERQRLIGAVEREWNR